MDATKDSFGEAIMRLKNLFTTEDTEYTEVLFNTPLRGEKRKQALHPRRANYLRSLLYSVPSVVQAFLFLLAFAPPAHADIAVRDDTGQTVHLAQAPKRIISLAPHITE